jgi:hypothetical protein
MIPGNLWQYLDNAVFLIQAAFILYFLRENTKRLGTTAGSLALALLQTYFVCPNQRIIFGSAQQLELFRFAPLDFRPSWLPGLSVVDAALIGILLLCLVSQAQKGLFHLVKWHVSIFLLLYIIGCYSLTNLVFDFDQARFLLASRSFVIFFASLFGGLLVGSRGCFLATPFLFKQLLTLYLLGCGSLASLSADERWGRYGMHIFMPAAGFWIVSYFSILFALFSRKIGPGTRAFFFFVTLFPLVGLSKTAVVQYIIVIFAYIIMRFDFPLLHFPRDNRNIIASAILLIIASSFVWIVGYVVFVDVDLAVSTRYFQLKNLSLTLWNKGPMAILSGIGWNQWYQIHVDFKEFDPGAWDAAEVANDGFRVGLQIPMVSILRSTGIGGLLLFVVIIYRFVREALRNYCNNDLNMFQILTILLVASLFSQFPELGFESCSALAFMIGTFAARGNLLGGADVWCDPWTKRILPSVIWYREASDADLPRWMGRRNE